MPQSFRLVVSSTFAFLAVGLVALLAIVGMTFWLGERAQVYFQLVNEARDTRTAAVELRNALQTAESSQRGYLLTGNEIYLSPFDVAKVNAQRQLAALERLVEPYPEATLPVQRLAGLVAEKTAELDQTVTLKRNRHDEEALARAVPAPFLRLANRRRACVAFRARGAVTAVAAGTRAPAARRIRRRRRGRPCHTSGFVDDRLWAGLPPAYGERPCGPSGSSGCPLRGRPCPSPRRRSRAGATVVVTRTTHDSRGVEPNPNRTGGSTGAREPRSLASTPRSDSVNSRPAATSEREIEVPVGDLRRLSRAAEMEARILEMAGCAVPDDQIAATLTAEGHRSPMRDHLLPSTVKGIRLRSGIMQKRSQSHPRNIPGHLTVPQLADRLQIGCHWIYDRIHNGTITVSRDPATKLYLFPDTSETLDGFRQLQAGEIQNLQFPIPTGC